MPKPIALAALVVLFLLAGLVACDDKKEAPPAQESPKAASTAASTPDPSGAGGPSGSGDPAPPPVAGAENLKILQFLPSGQVKTLNQIVVAFNQPMVPLGQYDQTPPGALELDPPLPGQFRWLNEYVLAFVPEKSLSGSLTLTAKVKPGLKSLSGSVLAEGAETRIELPAVEIESTAFVGDFEPEKGFRPIWRFLFNQPLDLKSLAEKTAFVATTKDGQKISIKAIWKQPASPNSYYYDPSLWAVEAQPEKPLPYATNFVLSAAPNLVSLAGPKTSPNELKILEGETPGPLDVSFGPNQAAPEPGCGQEPTSPCHFKPDHFFQIVFKTPVKMAVALNSVEFDPPYAGLDALKAAVKSGDYDPEQANANLNFWIPLKGLNDYRVTVKAGVRDVYGQELAQDKTFYFRTEAFPPQANLDRRLGILETSSSPIVPVTIANKPSVLVKGYALSAERVVELLRETAYDHGSNYQEECARLDRLSEKLGPAREATLRPPNEAQSGRVKMGVDLKKLFGPESLGHSLLLTLNENGKTVDYAFYHLTDLGLTSKIGLTDGLVWVVDLNEGRDLAGAELTLYGPGDQVYWRGVSDERGLAKTPGLRELLGQIPKNANYAVVDYQPLRDFYLAAKANGQLGVFNVGSSYDFSSVYFPAIDYSNFNPPISQAMSVNWLISAQPVYNPGETAHLKGVVRLLDEDKAKTPPNESKAKLAIYSSQGSLFKEDYAIITDWGTFSYDLPLPKTAGLGDYQVFLSLVPYDFPREHHYENPKSFLNLGSFRVQNFRPPAFALEFSPLPPAQSGQKVAVEAKAAYHFGAPAIDLPATYLVTARTATELAFANLEGFTLIDLFSNPKEEDPYDFSSGETILSSQSQFDRQGLLKFDLTVPQEDFPRPRRVEIDLTALDLDKRAVSNSAGFLAHPADLYVGLKTRSAVSQAGSNATMDFAVVDQSGQFLADQKVEAKLFRRTFQTVRRREIGATYAYQPKKVDEEVASLSLKSGDKIQSFEFTVPASGHYFVQAKVADGKGRLNQAAVDFYAFGPGPVGWDFRNDEVLTMIPDKTLYQPGETAKILVQSPFQTGQGLMTVERNGVRQAQTFALDSQSPLLEVPISAGDQPNVYVSVILTRGRIAERPDENNVDLGKPAIRKGYTVLNVAGNPDLLTVTVKPQKEDYRPGEEAVVEYSVVDALGQPAKGEVALAVVDAGVIQVGGDAGYFPEKEFFKRLPLTVYTFNNLSSLIGRQNWFLKGVEPGGGGGYAPAPADNVLRANFKNLAFFEPFAKLDENGRGEVSFTLPDNLTTFKIYAVATGSGRQTGTGQSQLLSTKSLTIRSSLPKKVGVGDEFIASAIVTSRDKTGAAVVEAKAENLEFLDPVAAKTLDLKAGTGEEVGYRVRAVKSGPAFLTFEAALGQENDAAKFQVAIDYKTALTTQAAFREITPGTQAIDLALDPGVDPDRGSLTYEIAPTLAPFLAGPLEYLEKYPYSCLEQSTSRALGALAALRVKNWRRTGPDEERRLRELVADQVAFLESRSIGGGFARWPSQSFWTDRDPLTTIYVFEFLLEAKKNGFPVKTITVNSIGDYIYGFVTKKEGLTRPPYDDSAVRANLLVYAIATLARAGREEAIPFLESFYQNRDILNYHEILCLTRGINALPRDKARVEQLKTLLTMIASGVNVGPGQIVIPALWLDSRRLSALTLLTLAEVAPYNSLIPGLIRGLGQGAQKGVFGSTVTNATALLALAAYINKAESERPELSVKAFVGEKELETVAFKSFVDKPVIQKLGIEDLIGQGKFRFLATGTGRAWATARLTSAPKEPDLQPVIANGLAISRTYEVIRPDPQKPGTTFRRGQVVKVTVTFMTPVDRYNLALEDYVPGGFEPINFSLKDADRSLLPSLAPDEDEGASGFFWYVHEEFWPDRVLASGPFVPAGVYTYTYLVRPATRGQYLVPGPKIEDMYSPETFGRGAGLKIVVE
jgi:uncharacterized protein YfaS (alpha-2-macroglobulin family)